MNLRVLCRTVAAVAVTVGLAVGATGPAAAYTGSARIDLRVLVLTDGSPTVEAIRAQLDREGVPYSAVDLTRPDRPTITPAYLSDTVAGAARAKYQGVVLPNATPPLAAAEMTALADFERRFAIRQVDSYVYPSTSVGLNPPHYSGALDGLVAAPAPGAAANGFGFLGAALPFEDTNPAILESYGYLATPAPGAAFTPLVAIANPGGVVIGSYAADGREELVITAGINQYQSHSRVLAHGVVEWLTRGVHLGVWRNWLSVHIDDIFLPDDRWSIEGNCTVGDGCGPAVPDNQPIRMNTSDVDELLAWQRREGLKLDMVFNGEGAVDAGAGDPLTQKLLANRGALRWVNHTYGHPYLGCVQDYSVVPWRCVTDPATGAVKWVSRATIEQQIQQNITFARDRGIAINGEELVTGEHSGLRTLPQMPVDNPNLAPALSATGVTTIASDNSREPAQRAIGPARTLPRYPMNIFYNVATVAEELDEYNWIYTRRADGGSGICEDNPATTTCIAPLSQADFQGYLVPLEARIALSHVLNVDPRPHYAHQSNLAEDRILYPVLDKLLRLYRGALAANTPLVNPTMSEASAELRRRNAWRARANDGTVEAYVQGGRVTIVNRGAAVNVPISVPAGTRVVSLSLLGIELLGAVYGQAYGGTRSAWRSLAATSGTVLMRVPG